MNRKYDETSQAVIRTKSPLQTSASRRRGTGTGKSSPHGPDLSSYNAIAQSIAALLHPHAEVVIHDLVNDRITGIWNAFSQREIGDPSNLLNDPELRTSALVIGPYDKAERDGSRIKSVSASLTDKDGERVGLLCINLDMSKFDAAIELLRGFATSQTTMPEVLFKGDLREQVNLILREELLRLRKSANALTKDDRREIVRKLDAANIFQARNSAPLVASVLGIGRGSIYHILRDVRER